MAVNQVSSSLYTSINGVCASSRSSRTNWITFPIIQTRIGTAFATGSPLLILRNTHRRKFAYKATSVSIRCEQSRKGNSLDVWLGRMAMVGFAAVLSVEIATGKGLLENFGLTAPLPTPALAIAALVGALTTIFIFQSASEN